MTQARNTEPTSASPDPEGDTGAPRPDARRPTRPPPPPVDDVPGTIVVEEPADMVTALDLVGEFDAGSSEQIDERVEEALGAGRNLIVNLSEATFIDSSTIRALLLAASAARTQGRGFVLELGTAPAVERLIEITGLAKVVPCASSREDALALLGSPETS